MPTAHRSTLKLLNALDHGDADRAAEITQQHIRNGYRAIRLLLTGAGEDDPFDLDVD